MQIKDRWKNFLKIVCHGCGMDYYARPACPSCGTEVYIHKDTVKEQCKSELKYDDVIKMYEAMKPIDPVPMNTESCTYNYPILSQLDVEGLG